MTPTDLFALVWIATIICMDAAILLLLYVALRAGNRNRRR